MPLDSTGQYNTSTPDNSRNIALRAALDAIGNEAGTVAKSFGNIQALLMQIKDATTVSPSNLKNPANDPAAEVENEINETDFRSVTGLEFISENTIPSNDPGISHSTDITAILSILNDALEKVNNSGTYGEISEQSDVNEETTQEYFPDSQNIIIIISPVENAEIEKELEFACDQFLLQPEVTALAQANQSAQKFLQLIGSR